MKLKIIEFGGTTRNITCDSFEFRSNQCTNWIKVKYPDGNSEYIHNISVIKTEEE